MKAGDRRAFFRSGLNELYVPFYDALCAELSPSWQPYSGLRSMEEQADLYAQGRTTPGAIVTNDTAGGSAHCYGCATDWTWFDGETLTWLSKDDARWQEFGLAVESVGLRWGHSFGDIDHTELRIDCFYNEAYPAWVTGGLNAAQDFLKAHLSGSPSTPYTAPAMPPKTTAPTNPT